MGAWGVGNLENDTAGDWAMRLREQGSLAFIRQTLTPVTDSDCYLDADPACEALAACETIARLKGNPGRKYADTRPIDEWVAAHPQPVPENLTALAIAVIDRVLGPNSELRELWDESESAESWRNEVEDLRRRVAS